MDPTKIKESDRPSDQELVAAFQQMRQELQSTSTKIGELEHECEEHMQVLDTLKPLADDRKCWRLMSGVLVERTVQEVKPQLEHNITGLKSLIQTLAETFKKRDAEAAEFQKRWNIKIARPGENSI